jgi:hypothetical protein
MSKYVLFLGTMTSALLVTAAAHATKTTFHVEMSWNQEEVPDGGTVNLGTPEHDPNGSADVTYDDVTKQLCGKITYADLTGTATGIHLHQAPLGDPQGNGAATAKMLIPPAPSPVTFNFTLSADYERSLFAVTGTELYLNIHTALNPTGECRTFEPWVVTDGPEVACPAPTNPDGGTGVSPAPDGGGSGTTSGNPAPTATATATTPSGGTSGGPTSGVQPPASDTPPVAEKKSGCNTTGTPSDALSLALLAGFGVAAISSRSRRKRR